MTDTGIRVVTVDGNMSQSRTHEPYNTASIISISKSIIFPPNTSTCYKKLLVKTPQFKAILKDDES